MMSLPPSFFPVVRTVDVNGRDSRPPVFGTLPRVCHKKQRADLEKARVHMKHLETVKFGAVHWHYRNTRVADGPWESDNFDEDHIIASNGVRSYERGNYSCLFLVEEKKTENA